MSKNTIVTIGRQSGSRGLEIGKKIAEILSLPCYDKEILTESAKKSGFAEETFREFDETAKKNTLLAWTASAFSSIGSGLPLSTQLYLAQFQTIRSLAENNSAVFVGRCSDYVLKDMGYNLINIFIYAPIDVRIQTIADRMNITSEDARLFAKRTDKERSSYYNYYTDQKWGHIDNYDLAIDSSKLSIDDTITHLISYIKLRIK